MTASEAGQYAANYLDIQQGVATWPGGGLTQANLQKHWTLFGCAEKRIFLPLQPPSGAPFVPTQQNAKSSGGSSSWVSSALTLAGTVLPMILGPDPKLNNADCQMLFTGAAVIRDILPMFRKNNPALVNSIDAKLTDLLKQYS